MTPNLPPDHDEFRAGLRRYLAQHSPEREVRRLMASEHGYDPARWLEQTRTLGVAALAIPERYGGSGLSYQELGIVFEEAGAALQCAPLFSSIALGANALLTSGDESAKNELLPAIASGEVTATLAIAEDAGRWEPGAVELAATRDGCAWRLSGVKNYVIDGHTAALVMVAARTGAGISLFVVDGAAAGLSRRPLDTLDPTRKQSRLAFDRTPARLVGVNGGAAAGLDRTLQLAVTALAAEQVGGARRCLEMAVEYAKERVQFGRPIGSFQAIKHKCVEMLVQVESAQVAVRHACAVAAAGGDGLPVAASLAKSCSSEAYVHAAAENIQIHGGSGFTWDHPAHLYYRRAMSSDVLFGDPAYHRELLAQHLGA